MDLPDPVADAMLAQRRVMISGVLDDATVATAVAQLMMLDGQSDEPLSVLVNADGPDLGTGLPLLDTLRLLRAPATIDVIGRANGAAAVAVAGSTGERRIGAAASMSLRLEPPRSSAGTAGDLAAAVDAEQQRRTSAANLIAQRTGQAVEWVIDEFESGGFHAAGALVELGLVDSVR
ncbi:MAG: ATP-dependent Clp protease proteolytic subunit [Actinomycetota bacterium]